MSVAIPDQINVPWFLLTHGEGRNLGIGFPSSATGTTSRIRNAVGGASFLEIYATDRLISRLDDAAIAVPLKGFALMVRVGRARLAWTALVGDPAIGAERIDE